MDKQPVGQLPDLTQSNNDDEIMVITNDEYNQLKKEKISDFITDLTSTDENNAIIKGTDGKLFTKDFGNASNITEGTLPTSVLPTIPLDKIPNIPRNKLPEIETDDLPDSGITANTYTYPTDITINSKGQVTSITEGQAGANNANQDLSNLSSLGIDRLNQSKALETGSVSTDVDVYADIQKYAHSTFDLSKFTVVGNPNITDDGILDCKRKNFVEIPFAPQANTDYRFDITFGIDQINLPGDGYIAGGGNSSNGYSLFELYKYNSAMQFYIRKSDSSPQVLTSFLLSVGVWNCFVKFNITTKSITVGYKTEAQEEYTTQTFAVDSFVAMTSCNIGDMSNPCSIDLKSISITADGKEIFNGNKTGIDVIKPDDYEVVGSPTISEDGIVSIDGAISRQNYVTKAIDLFSTNSPFKIEIPIKITELPQNNAPLYFYTQSCIEVAIQPSGEVAVRLRSGKSDAPYWDISNTRTMIPATVGLNHDNLVGVIEYTGYEYKLGYKLNNEYTQITLIESSTKLDKASRINLAWNSSSMAAFSGFFDLNAFKIYIDGNLVYQPCLKIPYTLSKTGSKIVSSAYRDRVQDMYEQYGYAPYYTIDEENENFTLPMGEIYGMIERSKTVNPNTLLESKWTDYPIFSPSWLLASENYLSQGAYPDVYAALEIEYDTTKIVGASYQLPSGGYYIKRGLEVALSAPPAPTVSATDGWTNPDNAFDDNDETYASCGTSTDYIELTYAAPVWVGGFTGTGNFVSGQANSTKLDMYAVDDGGLETLLCNGSDTADTAPYTCTGTCSITKVTKLRFKLNKESNSNPSTTYPTRYTNIEVTFANPDTAFILNQTDKSFRTPLTTRLASGKAVVGNGITLGITDGTKTFGLGSANNYEIAAANYYGTNIGYTSSNIGDYGDNWKTLGLATDPTKSGVELYSKDLYLYFYVGDVIKNVGEVNASELAGLLPMFEEVGGKLSLPDVHRYVDLTLGSSGSVYTSPADGWVGLSKISGGSNQYVALYAGTEVANSSETYYGYEMRGTGSGNYLTVMMPVQKGDQFYTTYSASGALNHFRFFYAVGDSTNASNS